MAIIVQHPDIAKALQPASQMKELPVVESSFIQNFSYDSTNFQLTVTMKNGGQYTHWYFYPGMWEQLIQSPSKGKFYADVIKGKHPSTRIVNKTVGKKGGRTNGR